MLHKHLQQAFERQHARLAIHQRQHDDAIGAFHGGVLVERRQHRARVVILADIDHDAHSAPVAFVADVGDAYNLFVTRQFSDALNQGGLVHFVGQLGDDDVRLAALAFFDVCFGLYRDLAAPGGIHGLDRIAAFHFLVISEGDAPGWEIRTLDELHQFVHVHILQALPVVDQVSRSVDDFRDVVRRDVGRHPNGNAGRAINDQVWQRRG